ncbi:MAG: hypothetical protein ACSLE3_01340 [Microbacteriaceae bacterium]
MMRRILWLIVGAAAGVIAAYVFGRTETGGEFFSEVDKKAKDFGDAVSDGYRAREQELRAAVANVEDAITEFTKKI